MKLTEWEAREAERLDNSGITVRKMNSYGSIAPSNDTDKFADNPVVPTKQCGSIISISYILYLMAAHSAKSGVYKVKQGSISKPALLCRDYQILDQ